MTLAPITVSGREIVVATLDEFTSAYATLSKSAGGGRIVLAADADPYDIFLRGSGGGQPVIITSENPDAPSLLNSIGLRDMANIRIENVAFAKVADGPSCLLLQDSARIQIVDCTFAGTADGPARVAADSGGSMGSIRWSDDVLFTGNTVADFFHGIGINDATNLEISGNTFTRLQGDGLRMGGVVNTDITGNTFSDFYGTSHSLTHPDMIQIWGTNADQLTRDVRISNNAFLTDDAASQTIFIRNERLFTDFTENFRNIEISGNLIYNGSFHGITVDDVSGLKVTGNTLLWNPQAVVLDTDGSQQPAIYIRDGVTGLVAEGNIGASMILPDGLRAGNAFISYNPEAADYVGRHFVNAISGGALDLADLRLLSTSPLVGEGAGISQPMLRTDGAVEAILRWQTSSDIHDLTFDARESLDGIGRLTEAVYDFVWRFDDGVTLAGITVERAYDEAGDHAATLSVLKDGTVMDTITRDFTVPSKDVFELTFEDGVRDVSDADADLWWSGAERFVASPSGQGVQLVGDTSGLTVSRDNPELARFEQFGLSLDLRLDGDGGKFLNWYQVMSASVGEDGAVSFGLETTDGGFRLATAAGVLDGDDWQRVGIGYDSDAERLGIYVDGVLEAETHVTGAVVNSRQNLKFGDVFGRSSAQVSLDNIMMGKDADIAGDFADPDAAVMAQSEEMVLG